MRSPAVLVVAVACGGAARAPAEVAAHRDPAPVTCRDVAAIVRGAVSGDDQAGRAREAAIDGACESDRWSRDVLDCVARERHPQVCLKRLDAAQAAGYDDRLAAWERRYGGAVADEPAAPDDEAVDP